MKIMVVAIGTAGDVLPFIGLGRALGRRQHQVHFLSLHHYRKFAEASGLVFHEIPDVNGATGHPDFYHPTLSMRLIARHALLPSIRPVYDVISTLPKDEWRIISDQVSYGARIASEKQGFRLITAVVAPFMLRSTEKMPVTPGFSIPSWAPRFLKRAFFGFVSQLWDRELAREVNHFRQSVGLAPVRDIIYNWSLSPDRVVGLFPEWFAGRPSDWPKQFVHGTFTAADLEIETTPCGDLEKAGDPLVVFCAGSAGPAAQRFFQNAINASRGRHWQAVLLAPHFESAETLPSNVIRCGYVPLSRLLPRTAAIVHHGGLGTISCALTKGVPQVVMPFGHDQFDNAARIRELGVGRILAGNAQNPSKLTDCLESVLTDEALKVKCQEIAAVASSGDSVDRLCEFLESEWQAQSAGELVTVSA
jgi:rhamnosyltransferase subunit B